MSPLPTDTTLGGCRPHMACGPSRLSFVVVASPRWESERLHAVRMKAFWIVLAVWAGAASCSAHVDTSSSVSLLQNDLGSEGPPRHALEPSYTFKADDLPHSLEEAGIEATKAESTAETPLWGKEATIRRRRRRRRTDKELGDLLDTVDRVKKAKRKEIDSKIGQCHTSVWGDWTPCQKDGTRSRTRIIEIQPQHGTPLFPTLSCVLSCVPSACCLHHCIFHPRLSLTVCCSPLLSPFTSDLAALTQLLFQVFGVQHCCKRSFVLLTALWVLSMPRKVAIKGAVGAHRPSSARCSHRLSMVAVPAQL